MLQYCILALEKHYSDENVHLVFSAYKQLLQLVASFSRVFSARLHAQEWVLKTVGENFLLAAT